MAQTIKDVVTWLKQWYYTEDEIDDLLDEKQDSLVSGTNIKTINNNSLLGSGNITIQGGSGGDGSLTKITLADGYDLYVNDNNHLAMLHIHKSVSLSGQWNTLLASAIPLAYRPLGWLGIPNNDDTIIVGDDGGIYYNNFSGSSSKTLDNQVNWFFVGGTSSYNVALTSNKSILSYYDSESAILTATVTDGSDNPVADVTVEFFNGSTSMGTATTNSSGIATKTYASTGAGDLSFTASVGSLSSETYSIEDCIIANVNKTYTGTSSSDTVYSLGYDEIADLSNIDFEMEWTFRETAFGCDVCLGASSEFSVSPIKSNYRVLLGNSRTGAIRYGYRTTSTSASTSGSMSTNTDVPMKIVKNGTSFTYYVNNNQLGTKTVSFWTNYNMFGLHTVQWNTGTTTISNLKIKPL